MNNSLLPRKTPDDVLVQIRTAHRLLAGYYQRLLPSIEKVSTELEIDFYFWEPYKFARPSRGISNPFLKWAWAWEMLPAMSALYVFKNVREENSIAIGDYLISFYVDSDTGVDNEEMKNNEIDGLSLSMPVEQAESIIKVSIYTPFKNDTLHWDYNIIWRKAAYPTYQAFDAEIQCEKDINGCPIVSSGFEVSVSQWMTEDGIKQLIVKIKLYLANALQYAKSIAEEDEIVTK